MRNSVLFCLALGALAGCGGGGNDVTYRPAPQILPAHIKKIAVRPAINKTQQFGLEDKLTRRVIDEFLRDGKYAILPEAQSDGIVVLTITRYILTPVQYDAVLTPRVYKLLILVDVQFIDKANNAILWSEPDLQGTIVYSAQTLPGGLTEEQAREQIWDQLSRDVVKRVIEGFGSVTGVSKRGVPSSSRPDPHQPVLPPKPVNPNPY